VKPPEFIHVYEPAIASAYRLREMAVKELALQEQYMHSYMQSLTGRPYVDVWMLVTMTIII
jgi:hypothetical protein